LRTCAGFFGLRIWISSGRLLVFSQPMTSAFETPVTFETRSRNASAFFDRTVSDAVAVAAVDRVADDLLVAELALEVAVDRRRQLGRCTEPTFWRASPPSPEVDADVAAADGAGLTIVEACAASG
jgi:hypothetical protein